MHTYTTPTSGLDDLKRYQLCPRDSESERTETHQLMDKLFDRWSLITTMFPTHDHVIHEAGHAYHLHMESMLLFTHPERSLENKIGACITKKQCDLRSERFALAFQLVVSEKLGFHDINHRHIHRHATQQGVTMEGVLWHVPRKRTQEAAAAFLQDVVHKADQW